ncbi:hypothetical protein T069G_02645 [Trichoderma breve]|uniref:Uncharacterized protein n=1 Tax=Trichoderma breve TaxID=2034170 RepID=A0A9W9BL15_9HYPO|nr:hypothetical protein T069G_02645 [Trichoderma breve]KAJ4861691.1 hypothetical protein T069G_02645 [Trichoderma breve]
MSAAKTEEKKVIKFDAKDLNLKPDDPRYKLGMHCLGTYWSQAILLETHEQEEMVGYLRNHDYYSYTTPSARVTATTHKLYHATMRAFDASGLEGLSRPIYLILSSLYIRLPREYLELIKDRFGTTDVINHEQDYWKAIRRSAAATNAATIRNKDKEDVASGAGQQVAVLDPVGQVKQSVALEEAKRPRALSDIPAIEPKRTRRAADNGGFDIDHVVAGVKSSLAIQRFANAAKPASIAAEKPRMTNSDLFEMKEDVKIAKETAMRNEAKIDAASTKIDGVSTKLDGFISEMRQFMTAFANTAGIPLPIEIVDESDNDNHE